MNKPRFTARITKRNGMFYVDCKIDGEWCDTFVCATEENAKAAKANWINQD